MGILDFLFGSKNQSKGIRPKSDDKNVVTQNIEIIENRISIEENNLRQDIKFLRVDRSPYTQTARDFFLKGGDFVKFDIPGCNAIGSSFDLNNGKIAIRKTQLARPHFMPSLDQAIKYFQGMSHSEVNSKGWSQFFTIYCYYCDCVKEFPILITKVEKIIIFMQIPYKKEIIGWRVFEVQSFLGTGFPVYGKYDFISGRPFHNIYLWDCIPDKSFCSCVDCSKKLKDSKRPQELLNSLIF